LAGQKNVPQMFFDKMYGHQQCQETLRRKKTKTNILAHVLDMARETTIKNEIGQDNGGQ